MARSFITKDKVHGFWIQDSLMQVVCWGLVKAIEESNDIVFSKSDFKEHLYNNSQGIFVGFMHLSLGEFIVDEKHKLAFLKTISNAKDFFLKKGNVIEINELNGFQLIEETRRIWIDSLETNSVVKVLDLLEDLVNDKIKSTSDES